MHPTELHPALPSPAAAEPGSPALVRAVVQVGDLETTYLVAGAGRPVVLLHGPRGARLAWGALAEILGGRRRLLAPEFPAPHPHAFSAWLRCFLDGLGLPSVGVVAQDEYALAALTFALLEPDRVERLALVHDDQPDAAVRQPVLEDRLHATGHPLLIIRRPAPGHCPPPVRSAIGTFFFSGAPGENA